MKATKSIGRIDEVLNRDKKNTKDPGIVRLVPHKPFSESWSADSPRNQKNFHAPK